MISVGTWDGLLRGELSIPSLRQYIGLKDWHFGDPEVSFEYERNIMSYVSYILLSKLFVCSDHTIFLKWRVFDLQSSDIKV